ncbi:hypothetical protein [Undibacterium curvum]|uniref:hypothetical protein n=1 Tax=Undibacterium curvum TaxID=2762294 RepID=UPI003D0F834D
MRFLRPRSNLDQLPAIALDAGKVRTLLSAAAYKQELLQQIAHAKNRIYLCSLYLQNDEAGAEILAALHAAKAARPALDIAVMVDWHRAQRGLIGEKNWRASVLVTPPGISASAVTVRPRYRSMAYRCRPANCLACCISKAL